MTGAKWKPENAVFKVGDTVFVYFDVARSGIIKKNFLAFSKIIGYYKQGYVTEDAQIYGIDYSHNHHNHVWIEELPIKFKDEIIKVFPKEYKDAYKSILKRQIKRIERRKEDLTINKPEKVIFT